MASKRKKIYIIGYGKTYNGNRTNAKLAWARVVELLESDALTISFIGDDSEYYEKIKGTYANFGKVFKKTEKLIVHHTDDFYEQVIVWLGYQNEDVSETETETEEE